MFLIKNGNQLISTLDNIGDEYTIYPRGLCKENITSEYYKLCEFEEGQEVNRRLKVMANNDETWTYNKTDKEVKYINITLNSPSTSDYITLSTPESEIPIYATIDNAASGKRTITIYTNGGYPTFKNGRMDYFLYSFWSMFYDSYAPRGGVTGLQYLKPLTITKLDHAFTYCSILDCNTIKHFDTSKVTNFTNLFSYSRIENPEALASWDTHSVTNLDSAFDLCTSITNIDFIKSWDVSNVTNIRSVFSSTTNLLSFEPILYTNLSNKLTSSFWYSFARSGISNLHGLENLYTSKITNFGYCFENNRNLTNISAIADWDVSSGTSFSNMFSGYMFSTTPSASDYNPITSVEPLENWRLSKAINISKMFGRCNALTDARYLDNWGFTLINDTVYNSLGQTVNVTDMFLESGVPTNKMPIWYPGNTR